MAHGVGAIFLLLTGLRILDQDLLRLAGVGVGVLVAQPDAGLDLIDVLPAGTTGAEGVPADLGGVYRHLDPVVHEGYDEDGGKGGHPLALSIVGRDADETVDTILALEIAVGVVALDLKGASLDPGLVAVLPVGDRHLVPVRLGPPLVHTRQHGGPVLTLGTTGTGVDLE